MPIFGSSKTAEPLPPPQPVKKSHNPFKKEPEPPPQPVQEPRRSGNFFNRRRSSSPSTRSPVSPTSSRSHGGLLHREKDDPSIIGARKRVADAEMAEKEADRALMAARASVNSAREEVKRLEREATEEARRAHIKQKQAGEIVNSAKSLGRHG